MALRAARLPSLLLLYGLLQCASTDDAGVATTGITLANGCPADKPIDVYAYGDICSKSCVETSWLCLELNIHAGLFANGSCRECPDPQCSRCSPDPKAPKGIRCDKCFRHFTKNDEGDCEIVYEKTVNYIMWVIVSIFGLLLFALVVSTASAQVYLANKVLRVAKSLAYISSYGGEHSHSLTTSLMVAEAHAEEHEEEEAEAMADESTNEEKADKAIAHGRAMAWRSSIMSGLDGKIWSGLSPMDKSVDELVGVGLPLFFNTQIFLILVSFIVWGALRRVQRANNLTNALHWAAATNTTKCFAETTELQFSTIEEVRANLTEYAKHMAGICFWLWLMLLLLTWFFVLLQAYSMYWLDKGRASNEDYTVTLTNLPAEATSEKRLMEVIEKKLLAKGKIHGVAITFDLKEYQPKLEAMIENLIQHDDRQLGWCPREISPPREKLKADMEKDKKELIELLSSKKILSTGRAVVVFKRQEDVQLLMDTQRGIIWDSKDDEVFGADPDDDIEGGAQPANESVGSKNCRRQRRKGAPHIVDISQELSEPGGIIWYNFEIPSWTLRLNIVKMYLVSGVLFFGFAWLTFIFYKYMMLPYVNIGLVPDANDGALSIVGNSIGVVNAIIQNIAQGLALDAGFTTLGHMDASVFSVNTIVVALNTATQLFFFSWQGTPVSFIHQADSKAIADEYSFSENLLTMMVPNLFIVQYALNEIFTALLPGIISYLVIHMIYIWRFGPESFRKMLLGLLPGPEHERSLEVITGREAEWALAFPDMLISLEYTFAIVYPAATFILLFLVSDRLGDIALYLFLFSIFFFLYQRFINMWVVKVTTHDSPSCFWAFITAWGLVLSMVPTASAWWVWRLDPTPNWRELGFFMIPITYGVCLAIYLVGTNYIAFFARQKVDGVDWEDPGINAVMLKCGYTWWNVNPLYVLRNRHCPDLKEYETLDKEVQCWATKRGIKGFYENGKSFKMHSKRSFANK